MLAWAELRFWCNDNKGAFVHLRKSSLAPRSLLPLHAVHHDLARGSVRTPEVRRVVVLLVPLEGDPSQLPTHAPHSATTHRNSGVCKRNSVFWVADRFLGAIFCGACCAHLFVTAVPAGQKAAAKNGETGLKNAAPSAAPPLSAAGGGGGAHRHRAA